VDLTDRFGRGFSARNLRQFRQFYLAWPAPQVWQKSSAKSVNRIAASPEPDGALDPRVVDALGIAVWVFFLPCAACVICVPQHGCGAGRCAETGQKSTCSGPILGDLCAESAGSRAKRRVWGPQISPGRPPPQRLRMSSASPLPPTSGWTCSLSRIGRARTGRDRRTRRNAVWLAAGPAHRPALARPCGAGHDLGLSVPRGRGTSTGTNPKMTHFHPRTNARDSEHGD